MEAWCSCLLACGSSLVPASQTILSASCIGSEIADNHGTNREMAVGNTFGATALSSYGGFWLSFAIILTPGGFEIESTLNATSKSAFADEFGLYLMVSTSTNPTKLARFLPLRCIPRRY